MIYILIGLYFLTLFSGHEHVATIYICTAIIISEIRKRKDCEG